jgi:hypothetical protein
MGKLIISSSKMTSSLTNFFNFAYLPMTRAFSALTHTHLTHDKLEKKAIAKCRLLALLRKMIIKSSKIAMK